MILFPAIDLKDGVCVRLEQGDMTKNTVFNTDPAEQAQEFARLGFEYLHLVDLNGAFEGKPVNSASVEAIRKAIDLPIQLGGGIRTRATIDHWLDMGITRVILGTAAVKDPELVRAAAKDWPGRIAVGIDARAGRVATEGWAQEADMDAVDLAKRFADAGVAAIIHTDIDRDGLLGGANIEASAHMARVCGLPVIVSGGMADLEDVAGLLTHEKSGIAGAIIGRALYDGRIDPEAAIALAGDGLAML